MKGDFVGFSDDFELSGGEFQWEPVQYRTFRFVRVEVETAAEPVEIARLDFRMTGYPLQIIGEFESSEPTDRDLWSVSIRTLRRCMHDTYIDCPYYEQLQYAMDTRLQALFGYQLAADDRLGRKAIYDFHCSMTPEGILQSRFPCNHRQIIPGFALHWMFMLEDHLLYFGDRAYAKRFRPTMDAVFEWFDRCMDDKGLIGPMGHWPYVDWVAQWGPTAGVPPAYLHGPLTVANMMTIYALETAARINEATGRPSMAEEYRQRGEALRKALRSRCYDPQRKFFTDGPGVPDLSQHCQLWAILTGVVEGKEAKDLLERTLEESQGKDAASWAKVSYAMSFYMFRALEMTGMYDRTEELWKPWRDLAAAGMTTWPEDPVGQRSDCHGWGSIPLFEFPALILGVRPRGWGYEAIEVRPHPLPGLTQAHGTVATPHGPVRVSWKRDGVRLAAEVNGPTGRTIELILPSGERSHTLKGQIKAAG